MKVNRTDEGADTLADPLATTWSGIEAEPVPLAPAPIDNQPSNYIRTAHAGRENATVPEVRAQVAETGGELLVRLTWDDETPEREHQESAFPDAAAVMFPLRGDAPLTSMGSTDQPVALWYWRPDLASEAEELTATGLGTVERVERIEGASFITARSHHEDGRWSVVLRRVREAVAADRVDVAGASQMAIAVWEGSAGERGGFKSASEHWCPLVRGEEAS